MQSEQQLSEGFESNKTIIEQDNNINSNSFSYRPTDYSPRVLLKTHILKKLPEEMNNLIQIIEPQPQPPNPSPPKKNNEQFTESDTPQNVYESECSAFQLIYSKSQSCSIFGERQQNFTSHEISLKHLSRYQQQNYYLLKHFQQPSQNSKSKSHLIFDSKFQCGNLLCAYQSLNSKQEYHLFMENDTNRCGYNQWFCFSIRGMKAKTKYCFKIVNFRKSFSFFKMGMRPITFSLRKHRRSGNGWDRRGTNVGYGPSPVYDVINNSNCRLYCLSFELEFEEEDDTVFISSGFPYSYSRLIRQLKELKEIGEQNNLEWTQRTIAYSLSNNQVPYLIIRKSENPINENVIQKIKKKKHEVVNRKPIILIFARQHPGQSHSSFLMQQFLRELALISKRQTKYLLQHYEFHIFPMINVDGVIYGNFRCDLAGFDLNRIWRNPLKQLHPQIHAIVQKIKQLNQEQKIVCCFDFHSHSKQYNIFSYCCKQDEVESRILPFMMSKINEVFHFPSCTFGLSKDKFTTARATLFSLVKHANVLTVQSSSFGSKLQNKVGIFDPVDFMEFARGIIETLKGYFEDGLFKKDCETEIREKLSDLQAYQRQNQEESGSDSQVEIDSKEHLKVLKFLLPESTLKKFEGKCTELSIQKRQYLKLMQKKEQQSIQQKTANPIFEKYQKSQIKQKPKLYHKVQIKKQQILAIMRTKQSPRERKIENNQIIRMPLNSFKARITKYDSNKTETINDKESFLSQSKEKIVQKPKQIRKNRSSLMMNSSIQKESKANTKSKPEVSRFKLRSYEEQSGANIDMIINRVGDKRNTDIRRMSKIQKILRIRKRANTLKNIMHQQCKSHINNNFFQLKISESQAISKIEKAVLLTKNQTSKLKMNKSSTIINKMSSLNDQEAQLCRGQSKKGTKIKTNGHPNSHTSLIGQLWRINYGRYSKELA